MTSSRRLPIDTVIYFNDVETDALWQRTLAALRQARIDAVDFYFIREHELRHPELQTILPRLARHAQCAAELRALSIHTGVGFVPTLGWGQAVEDGPFDKITAPDGTRSGMGSCPLDPRLADYLEQITLGIARAGFDSINLEDDFQNDNHRPVKRGCYCPRHLEAFSQSQGRAWSRPQLVEALAQDSALAQQWNAFRLGVLVKLMTRLHQAGASVQPKMTFTLLAGADVNFAPGAFLDSGLIRRWRPTQAGYNDDRTGPLECAWRGALSHQRHGRPRGISALAEITSWPRNSYTKSWATVTLQAAANAFMGIDTLLLWLGHGLRDPHFNAAIGSRRAWLDAIARACDDHPQIRGLAVPVRPTSHVCDRSLPVLARMGIPLALTTDFADIHGDDPILLAATDAHIPGGVASLAGRPLVLDSAAIAVHGPELGLGVTPAARFFSCEQFSDHELYGQYRGMYSSCLTLLAAQEILALTGADDAQPLAHYLDNQSRPVTPSVLLDRARQRLLFNHTPATWNLLIGFGKSQQLRGALSTLLGRPLCAAVANAADVALLVRDSSTARVALALNLSHDAAADWALPLDFTPRATAQLQSDGSWQTLAAEACPARGQPAPLPPRSATLWRFSR